MFLFHFFLIIISSPLNLKLNNFYVISVVVWIIRHMSSINFFWRPKFHSINGLKLHFLHFTPVHKEIIKNQQMHKSTRAVSKNKCLGNNSKPKCMWKYSFRRSWNVEQCEKWRDQGHQRKYFTVFWGLWMCAWSRFRWLGVGHNYLAKIICGFMSYFSSRSLLLSFSRPTAAFVVVLYWKNKTSRFQNIKNGFYCCDEEKNKQKY